MSSVIAVLLALGATAIPKPYTPVSAPGQSYYQDVSLDREGHTLYLTRIDGALHKIVVSKLAHGNWSPPTVLPFSGHWRDLEQVLSPDEKTMIFASNRPIVAGGKPLDAFFGRKYRPRRGGNLWSVSSQGRSWGEPVRLPDAVNANTSTFSPAVTANGTLYFMRASGPNQRFHIFLSKRDDGAYRASALAPFSDIRYSDFDPAIASDESFVIFGSNRPPSKPGTADLFISFHRRSGWTPPTDMGQSIDQPADVIEPRLSPDDQTLYFTHSGDPNPLWSVDIRPWVGTRENRIASYDYQVVAASAKDAPTIDLDDGIFANVSQAAAAGLTIDEIAAETSLSSSDVRTKIDALSLSGLLKPNGNTYRPTYPIIDRLEGLWFAHLDDALVDRIARDVERGAPAIRRAFTTTLALQDSDADDLTLMYLGDVLFDRWQVRHVRTGFLGAPQPPRAGKVFYVAALQRMPLQTTSAFGLYAHQEQSYDAFTVVTYGNGLDSDPFGDVLPNANDRVALLKAYQVLASGGAISGSALRELNALHFVEGTEPLIPLISEANYAQLHTVTELFTPTLLRELNADRLTIFRAYANSGYARDVTFQEFALWWYHFLIVDVTQRLISDGAIRVPAPGFTTMIVSAS